MLDIFEKTCILWLGLATVLAILAVVRVVPWPVAIIVGGPAMVAGLGVIIWGDVVSLRKTKEKKM